MADLVDAVSMTASLIRMATKLLQARTDRAGQKAKAEGANVYIARDGRRRVVAAR